MFFQSQTPKFRPKNQQKKQPGNRYEKSAFLLQKWVLPCALQCPRIVPGSSQDRPRTVPESPRTPKWKHHACQMALMGTKIHKKSLKIQAWTLKCPLLCSPVSQNRPRVPKYAKVKPPIMVNDRFAYQECQGPLATMPRNCNPEAMSNDRGPAAEGVAHKTI